MEHLKDLKINIRRRFEFIEFCLLWDGKIGRPQLQDQFAISPQQATKDLTSYLDSHPKNMIYDPRRRAYIASEKFKPRLIEGSASEYFTHLEMLANKVRTENEIWIQSVPNFDIVSASSRRLSAETVQSVTNAIKAKQPFKAQYSSLSSKVDKQRTLLPHAIASDGHRWHMRAYHFEKKRYSDFVLSRLNNITACTAPDDDIPKDKSWHTTLSVELEPDIEQLNEDQCSQLQHEYEMKKGVLQIKTRQAMLFYILRYYGFNPHEQENGIIRNKSSFWLKIRNPEEVEAFLERR